MITATQMYWITRLDGIKDFLDGLVIICGILGLISLFWVFNFPDDPKWCPERASFFLVSCGIMLAVSILEILTPSSKEIAIIIVGPKIFNNEKVQKLPSNLVGLANDWIEELKPKHKEK